MNNKPILATDICGNAEIFDKQDISVTFLMLLKRAIWASYFVNSRRIHLGLCDTRNQ